MRLKDLLIYFSLMLCGVLLVLALVVNIRLDKPRLEEVATAPLYTGSQQNTQPTTKPTPDSTESELSDAPDAVIYDAQGNPVSISDFKGRPVVVNFRTSWSNLCTLEYRAYDTCYKEYGQDVCFVMISIVDGTKETKETALAQWEQLGAEMPLYFDMDGSAVEAFRVKAVPASYFINAEGKLVAYSTSNMTRSSLDKALHRCMGDSEETP